MTKITIVQGDITKQDVDAIVNAANETLLGGGGVDGAIHRASGPELLAACRELNGCAVGKAKLTNGYNLSARYVVHTVGPVYEENPEAAQGLLRACYLNSLRLAAAHHDIRTIAFPAISTGVYGYPKEAAATIAVETVRNFLAHDDSFEEIRFITYSDADRVIYDQLLTV